MNANKNTSISSHPNHKYLCWLNQIKGVGRQTIFPLLRAAAGRNLFDGDAEDSMEISMEISMEKPMDISIEKSTEDCMEAARILYTAPEARLRFLCAEAFPSGNKGAKAARQLLSARKTQPEKILDELARAGIAFSCILEKDFPERLRMIPDPPFGIYYKGRLPSDKEPAAGVIGARLASGYGKEQARRFGWRLGNKGIAIVSGMARGIDGIAQKAALDAGGSSFAVLGCGVDICYPKENAELYERLMYQGGVISEYPPGTPPESKLFPPRNRIISGLSDLVFVVEARSKSGTLITVDMALEQGREVFALPGRVSDSLSDGCNRLIRQGAGVATCPEDILEFFFGTADESGEKEDAHSGSERHADAAACSSVNMKTRASGQKTADIRIPGSEEGGEKGRKKEEGKKETETGIEIGTGAGKKHFDDQGRTPLEKAILRVLSAEEETHLERILEGVNRVFKEEGRDPVQITALIPALMRLQIDKDVREETPGYYVADRSISCNIL